MLMQIFLPPPVGVFLFSSAPLSGAPPPTQAVIEGFDVKKAGDGNVGVKGGGG